MRIFSQIQTALLTICFVGTPVFADSHGNFPGKGSIDAYSNSVDIGNKALEYSKKGDYESAVKYDREAISIYPYDSAWHHNLGFHLAKLGRFDEARKEEEQATELEPNYVGAWIAIGLTYENQHRLTEAERYYRKAVQINPNSYGALIDLGDILRQQGHFNEAREWLSRAKACPDSSKIAPGEADKKLDQCNRKEASN